MTVEQALELVKAAKDKARRAASKHRGVDDRSHIRTINAARPTVIEGLLCAFAAQGRDGDESGEVKTALELRNYWEMVAQTIGAVSGDPDALVVAQIPVAPPGSHR